MSLTKEEAIVKYGGDLAPALVALADAKRDADAAIELLGIAVRDTRLMGHTWGQIGDVLGISKQAAQQKFRRWQSE